MSERSRAAQAAAYQELVDHAEVAEHAYYDAAVAVVCSLFDVDAFQRAWLLMSTKERDDVIMSIANGIEKHMNIRTMEILTSIAAEI